MIVGDGVQFFVMQDGVVVRRGLTLTQAERMVQMAGKKQAPKPKKAPRDGDFVPSK